LCQLADKVAPCTVQTDGLGIFTGPVPVLFLAVIRSPALTKVHQQLWQAITAAAVGATLVYAPEHWIPHITLAQGDMTSTDVAEIAERLSSRRFQWQIPLTNLAVISTMTQRALPIPCVFGLSWGSTSSFVATDRNVGCRLLTRGRAHLFYTARTTSAASRSICSASSKSGWSWISSAPASATSRRPAMQDDGGPQTATAFRLDEP
jgi:hypothetical protein